MKTKSEGDVGKDAGAALSDQQMRPSAPRYPVDRYLVESSKKIETVNIIDDDIWNPEPGLRPEDEIMLRKLHEMLQSTADDLKLLSGQLSKFHEPGVQVKTMPTPLDEEFNEKVHIEEVVNAKFHGYKIVDNLSQQSLFKRQEKIVPNVDSVANDLKDVNKVDGVVRLQTPFKSKDLGFTRTKIVQINGANNIGSKDNSTKIKNVNNKKSVVYNEYRYKYVEPEMKESRSKLFQIQNMPSINIRSELKEQEVLHLDIIPNEIDMRSDTDMKRNISLVSIYHEAAEPITKTTSYVSHLNHPQFKNKRPTRKISKMSTCESSESANNVSSDAQYVLKTQKQIKKVIRASPNNSTRSELSENKKKLPKDTTKRLHLDHWKKKLNTIYGQPSSSKHVSLNKDKIKTSLKSSTLPRKGSTQAALNNKEYIPYSQLTIGGVKVSDIEREISGIRNKHDIPLSPILDKIVSSRENSFHIESSQKKKNTDGLKFLTTSDENLLQEVIDIEKTVSETLSKQLKNNFTESARKPQKGSSENDTENDSYVDDFEDEKSDHTLHSEHQSVTEDVNVKSHKSDQKDDKKPTNDAAKYESQPKESTTDIHNKTYTKVSNLSFKNAVDIFEFVHSVDTQDTATQSNATSKISLKETQTSPRNDKTTIQPIHNDLWPSIDTGGDVEKMFKLEKDFIKRFILEEYGDLLEKNLTKASTSKYNEDLREIGRNVNASQKITQTSPARVKSVMTSPRHSKTRTTSPLAMSFNVDHQTSPMIFITNDEESKIKTHDETGDITANLSSARFSLRLPQTSREVLTNLETTIHTPPEIDRIADEKAAYNIKKFKTFRKLSSSSSSSVDGDISSSSDISSLGEFNINKRLPKRRISKISESSYTSTTSKNSSEIISSNSGIIPLKSEGEISIRRNTVTNKSNKTSKSEGEMSFKLH